MKKIIRIAGINMFFFRTIQLLTEFWNILLLSQHCGPNFKHFLFLL